MLPPLSLCALDGPAEARRAAAATRRSSLGQIILSVTEPAPTLSAQPAPQQQQHLPGLALSCRVVLAPRCNPSTRASSAPGMRPVRPVARVRLQVESSQRELLQQPHAPPRPLRRHVRPQDAERALQDPASEAAESAPPPNTPPRPPRLNPVNFRGHGMSGHSELSPIGSSPSNSSPPEPLGSDFSPPVMLAGSTQWGSAHLTVRCKITSPDSVVAATSELAGMSVSGLPTASSEGCTDPRIRLCFDPHLNIYFDPVTRKYFELT